MTYSPGWSVIEQTLVRRERWPGGYTVKGTPLVRPGQEVVADQPVLRLERSQPVSGALPPLDEGAREGNNGVAVQTETVPAGLRGRVVDITRRGGVVIEGRATVVRGAIGVGKQVAGVLTMWQSGKMGRAASIPAGALLVVPGPVNFAFLHQALLSNISGMIASSIELRDLEGFLRTDLISLLANADLARVQDSLPPLTLCLTEGLGTLMMPVHVTNLLSKYQGALALLSGTTSLRHELFPDLLITLPEQSAQADWQPVQPDLAFTVGARVRICGGEYEGKTGVINYLFKHQQVFSWGLRERAALLGSEDGATLVVPLALLARIG
ncbi:MAG TPA: KOW motif-containing protein [Ktedonobacteraceae bacterium]|nr:KOW motif-containing protein [Ktedonobacteraceae bacterium]